MKGYRTVLFGALVAILSPLLTYMEGLKASIGACAIDGANNLEVCALPWWVGTAIGAAIIGLRVITTSAIFNKS